MAETEALGEEDRMPDIPIKTREEQAREENLCLQRLLYTSGDVDIRSMGLGRVILLLLRIEKLRDSSTEVVYAYDLLKDGYNWREHFVNAPHGCLPVRQRVFMDALVRLDEIYKELNPRGRA